MLDPYLEKATLALAEFNSERLPAQGIFFRKSGVY
jgi:hypothetical protein